MTTAPTVQPNSVVTLHYTLTLQKGEEVDTSRNGQPVTIRLGSGDWVEFLERCLLGMTPGERRQFEINANDTAVLRQEADVQYMPRKDFPPEMELEAGRVFGFVLPSGEEVAGQVINIEGDRVAIDFTHPLAGRDLMLDVEILAVE